MIQVYTCDQGSDEWRAARLGIPTASEFGTVLASGRSGGESKTRRTYMLKLAGEILTGEPAEHYSNGHMERGHEMEPEARDLYAFAQEADLERIGFIRNGDTGCSPDALIGDRGMLEIKTKLPHLAIDAILKGDVPAEHLAQCQGSLWIAEREWIDVAVYWPKLPLYVRRAHRDEAYIAKLAAAVARFNEELADTVDRVRRYSGAGSVSNDLHASSLGAA